IVQQSTRRSCRACRAPRRTRDLRPARIYPCRRPDELRRQHSRPVLPIWRVCRPHPPRRQTRGFAISAADQVRADAQSKNGQGPRPRSSANAARPRRRGDRIIEWQRQCYPMTPEQIDLVRKSFDALWPFRRRLAEQFYGRFFELAPDTRRLFPNDMERQQLKLMDTIAAIVG